MYLYQAYDSLIESSVPFPDLLDRADQIKAGDRQSQPRFIFKISDASATLRGAIESVHSLSYAGLADFFISQNRNEIICLPQSDATAEAVRNLFLDEVLPCLLGNKDQLAFHASAVETNSGAFAFLGESGAGKSTICASFVKAGFRLLTDDSLLIRGCGEDVCCIPSYPGVRLWAESADYLFSRTPAFSDKLRLAVTDAALGFSRSPVALRKIFVLNPRSPETGGDEVTVDAISPREAFHRLFDNLYRLSDSDCERLKEEVELIARILNVAKTYRLSFPHDFSALGRMREFALNSKLETPPSSFGI